ncbi:hypothetical protein GALMADRAFT_137314 [Galerina marginata CBS 339.88]|uniref:Uncharacterized protein n=1 Tax=Galerina marginata (strain CBS 339.88) TaxID=685588 RepID=A0A067TKM2_GALM3|nr:hypothetical protein GALMADRAFT_137314 [Galerina marginata CBS 339.88]
MSVLELRVNSPSVRLYPVAPPTISDDILAATAMTPGANSPSAPSVCLLRGPLDDFIRYSREEASKWLIDLAHDICDPTEHRGSLLVWKEPEQWHPVATTDPLTASIYRYDLPVGITVGLSKISQRARKSATIPIENANAMADRVKRRDGRCWVTAMLGPLANSHICPKRMGDHVARIIFRTFTSLPLPPNLSIYDEVFGLSFSLTLDAYFDEYEMGLRFVSPPNNYECHVFAIEQSNVEYTIFGEIDSPACHPALHEHHASPPHPQLPNLPPPGLIRWHYLQCVLKRFAHDDYKNLENIYLPELPLRMKGDSDYEGTDSEAEWPSKVLDLGRVVENDLEEREERHQAVESWISKTV